MNAPANSHPDDALIRQHPDILRRRLSQHETLILRPEHGAVLELRGTALDLWGLLETPTPLQQVIDRLAAQHGVSAAEIGPDVARSIDELAAAGAVERMEQPG